MNRPHIRLPMANGPFVNGPCALFESGVKTGKAKFQNQKKEGTNMNIKKLLSLLAALAMLLTFCAGCAPQETPADDSADQAANAGADETAEDTEDEVGVQEQKTITLTVTYEDGTSEDYTVETTAEFLKEAIEATVEIEGSEGEFGFTLTSVNGVEADFTDGSNAYWAIYVNDEYGMYALDTQPVTDGDSYALVYETY